MGGSFVIFVRLERIEILFDLFAVLCFDIAKIKFFARRRKERKLMKDELALGSFEKEKKEVLEAEKQTRLSEIVEPTLTFVSKKGQGKKFALKELLKTLADAGIDVYAEDVEKYLEFLTKAGVVAPAQEKNDEFLIVSDVA